MHDFSCTDAKDMYNKVLADRVRYFKEDERGVEIMCREMEIMRNQAHVEGIEKGGELVIKGPNIMMGYIMPEHPGKLVPLEDGWYHTGDVVEIDEIGFVYIKDRIKRFAKIGGEMVSLNAVHEMVCKAYEWMGAEFQYGIVAVPHESKGEQIVLVTNNNQVTQDV